VRRVLVISRMFPQPDAPCSGPFVHEQVKALRQRGLEARVLCGVPFPLYLRRPFGIPGRWGEWRRTWTELDWTDCAGVPVLYAPYHVGWFARLLRLDEPYRDAIVRAGHWLRGRFDFDLIHAHTAHPDGFAAREVARMHGKPLVITEHTSPFSDLTSEPRIRRKTLIALATARRVWCVSESLTREVAGYFPPEQRYFLRTLYNGVDTALFQPPSCWRPNPAAPRFLFIGFLVEQKNVPILLDAFARLRRKLPDARLNLVGEGPLRTAIEQQIASLRLQDSVQLLGERTRAEVARLLREECDVLVLPSKHETFGVVLIEALASGKPVVASRCGGPESVITAPFLGTLCPRDDAAALADALQETAAQLADIDPVRIRKHAVERFGYGNLAAALADQYEEILTVKTNDPLALSREAC
jgi:glycosyltransferase involved in cell wall biosynthesis